MAYHEISGCDQHDVKADDDEGADRDVGDDGGLETVQDLAAIEYAEEEADVDGVEEGEVQNMLTCMESIQMPGQE